MSFVQHTWVTGETVTATLLNRIEQGIADLEYEVATDSDIESIFEDE